MDELRQLVVENVVLAVNNNKYFDKEKCFEELLEMDGQFASDFWRILQESKCSYESKDIKKFDGTVPVNGASI